MAKLSVRGVTINYQLLNAASGLAPQKTPCVVYLHGLIMDNLSSGYFTFAQGVSAQHTLLLYDLRGHGKSSIEPKGYQVADHANELNDLLEALTLERAPLHLIGSSFGGAVALEFARLYPQRVASIILVDGHPQSSDFLSQLGADLTAPPDKQRALIAKHFQHWFSRDIQRKRDRLAKRAQALLHQTSLIEDLYASAQQSKVNEPLTLPPTLALYGAKSDALRLAKDALQGRHEVTWKLFPDRSHALLWEETNAVTLEIIAWLDKRAQRP